MVLAQIPTFVIGILVVLFLLVSVVMILTVLIQRPMGGGLSGAFGSGAGSGQTAFGAKTGDVLTVVTIVVFATWLIGAIGLNFATRPPAPPTGAQVLPASGDAGATSPETEQPAGEDPEAAAPGEQPTQQPAEQPGDEGGETSGDTGEPGGGEASEPDPGGG